MSSTRPRAGPSDRGGAARFVLASVAVFVALFVVATALYPGGTWCDPTASGHAFFGNFLCDLTWSKSLGGAPNPIGSWVARGAMLVLAAGLLAFFFAVTRLFRERRRLELSVHVLAVVAITGSVAVTLMPSETFGDLHGVLVMIAGAAGLSASVLVIVVVFRAAPIVAVVGALTLAAAFADLVLYVWHFFHRADCAPATPAVQKVALGLLLTWLVVGARRSLRT